MDNADRPIRGCICFQQSFAHLKEAASEYGWASAEELMAETGCGSNCGLCVPFIRRMLESGETAFAAGEIPLGLE